MEVYLILHPDTDDLAFSGHNPSPNSYAARRRGQQAWVPIKKAKRYASVGNAKIARGHTPGKKGRIYQFKLTMIGEVE